MLYTAEKQPAVFFATCARLIGPEVKLTIEQSLPGNLSMEDWQTMKEVIAAVRQAIPDASSKPPGAVLEHVLGALSRPRKLDQHQRQEALQRLANGETLVDVNVVDPTTIGRLHSPFRESAAAA